MNSTLRRLGYALLTVTALCTGGDAFAQSGPADASNAPVNEVAVEMPPYEVKTDRILPPPESWYYVLVPAGELTRGKKVVIAPGYEVLSNYSEKNTRLFIDEVQRRQLAGTILWPAIMQAMPRRPMVVIADGNKQARINLNVQDALNWEGDPIASMDRLRDGYSSTAADWSDVNEQGGYTVPVRSDPFVSRPPAANSNNLGTRFSNGAPVRAEPTFEKRTFRLLPPGVVRISEREGFLAASIAGDGFFANSNRFTEEELARGLSQESTRFALYQVSVQTPLWLKTGLTWLIASTEITPTRITFADARVELDKHRLPSLLAVLSKDKAFTSEEERFACAFTHFGLYGNNSKLAPKFIAFAQRAQTEPVTDKLIRECFGMSAKALEKELVSFVHSFSAYKSRQLNGSLPDLPACTVRKATQSEVARLKAESLIAQGEPDLALDELRIAYLRGEREPAMLALLAEMEAQCGSLERSRKIIRALTALPEPPPRIFLVQARLAYRDLTASRQAGSKFASSETIAILAPLGRAIQGGFNHEGVCELFAKVVLASYDSPDAATNRFLVTAARRFPKNDPLRRAAAITPQL